MNSTAVVALLGIMMLGGVALIVLHPPKPPPPPANPISGLAGLLGSLL